LHLEALEDRRLLATFAVTNLNDFGIGSLRQAIIDANNEIGPDTIDATGVSGTIALTSGEVLIIGGGLTIDGPGADQLTIDAQGNSRIFNINTGTADDYTIRGLTLTGGRTIGDGANSTDDTFRGGAVRSLATGTLTIEEAEVIGNRTDGDFSPGGGIHAAGNVTINSSTISGNTTLGFDSKGGAIHVTGNVEISDSLITQNGTADDGAFGGAMYVDGTVDLLRSTVSHNTTEGDSTRSAGFVATGNVSITESTVSDNQTSGMGGRGAGVWTAGELTVTKSTVSRNRSEGNSSFGGGLYSQDAVTIVNSTISGNRTAGASSDGGGVFAGGPLTIHDSTIIDNHATYPTSVGGGIWNGNDAIEITNSIIAGNTAGGVDNDIEPGGGALNVNYSLIGVDPGGLVGVGNITGMDPLLGPLTFNGGPTQTHALLPGSMAIDAGDPGIVFSPTEFDQRGAPFVRVVDGGGGLRVDMGAFERQLLSGTLVVDTSLDESDGDFSVGDLSLREAVELANGTDVDTIEFDPVVFATPQTILLELGEIQIGEGVTIDGPGAELVTIDAQQNSRIFNFDASAGDLTLRGLTLTGGRTTGDAVNGSDDTYRGGAIRFLSAGTLAIEQSVVTGNGTEGDHADGGAIFSDAGAVALTDSTLTGNGTEGMHADGGGIFTTSAVTLTNSTLSNNSTTGDNARGGGIVTLFGPTTVTNSTLSGNTTAGIDSDGGAISALFGDMALTDSVVSGNSTAGDYSSGGGIFAGSASGTVTLTNTVVSNNSTAGYLSNGGGIRVGGDLIVNQSTISGNYTMGHEAIGGGANVVGGLTMDSSRVSGNHTEGDRSFGGGITAGPLLITNSTIDSNTTAGYLSVGGGIFTFASSNATFTQVTVSNNSTIGDAASGGGIYVVNAPAITLERSTVSANTTSGTGANGGGIFVNDTTAGAASLTILNSIVAENTVGAGSTNPDLFHDASGVFDPDYSLIGDTSGLTAPQIFAISLGNGNLTNVDPLLGPLAYNGGPTETHALLTGSPAIDAGDPSIASVPDEFDQRGDPFLRVRQGMQGGGVIIDMGAYERQGIPNPSLVVDTAVDESDGDYSVGDLSLREAIGLANGDLGANTITFDSALRGATISLVLGQLDVTDSVTITGLGADLLTIDAQQGSRVFNIDDGDDTAHHSVTISGLTITGGEIEGDGAGIRSRERLELVDSVVSGNSATGAGLATGINGGGVYLRMFGGMAVTISGSTIAGNSSAGTGGGIHVLSGVGDTLEITSSTISGNEANLTGGGMLITGDGATNISHSTIADNIGDANMTGFGGVGGIFDSSGNVTLYHTIVGSNTDTTGPENDLDGTFTANFSLVGDTSGATILGANNILNQDPRLAPLADNGGPTPTHSLLPISPALNTGDISIVGAPPFDQRGPGFTRIVGARIDRGALEVQGPSADFDFDGLVTGIDFLLWQIGFGTPMPLATKNDGDADNDTDTDNDDLDIWEVQYGGPAPVVAASSAMSVAESQPMATASEQPLSRSDLADLALTVELAGDNVNEREPFADAQRSLPNVMRTTSRAPEPVPAQSRRAGTDDSPTFSESGASDHAEHPWLTDELLELVFG
jgi:hypothetical protein